MVRSVTTREPEWTEQDRGEILALALYRSQLCPLHGGPLDECTFEGAEARFEVPLPTRCRAQDLLLIHQAARDNTDRPEALLWSVIKKGR